MNPITVKRAREAMLWTTWRLQLTIPSVLAKGEEFALRMTAFGPDGLPSGAFPREIVFEDSPGIEGLPKSTRFAKDIGGHITIEGLRAVGPEYAFVSAIPEGCPGKVASNPAWVFEDPPYRVFWGDLHIHTTYSNCMPWSCKEPEFAYEFARDAAHLDFAAAADHLRGIASDANRWARLQELAQEYEEARRFVPFLAFESSHKTGFGGDNNAYFLETDAPYFWLDREDMRGTQPEVTLRQLWDFLDATGKGYFTVPHHTGRAGKYRSFADADYDVEREPLFEIFSGWGSSESRCSRFPLYAGNSDEPAYFVDALKAGCRYGVIASSDDHTTLPGGESTTWGAPAGPKCLAAWIHKGLAAVRAQDLTRDALWRAMKSRNCYGTTFSRTLLDFSIDGLHMGQEGEAKKDGALWRRREVRVRILSTDRQAPSVALVRNGEEIARKRSGGVEKQEVVFEDEAPLDGIAVRDARFHPGPFVVYYVRAETQHGQTQWSSPVWLDVGE